MTITPRHITLDLSDIPRYWLKGNPFITHFLNSESLLFPQGELFFMDSVKYYARQIDDPQMKEDVRGFIRQEALHTARHKEYNQWLVDHGYDITRIEKRLGKFIGWAKKRPPLSQLALTVAMEHLTAIMSDTSLRYEEIFDGVHPTMKLLWHYHGAEEIEHKAVAFDVYKKVGGGYWRRALWMNIANIVLFYFVISNTFYFLRRDKKAWSPRVWWGGFKDLFISPGFMRKTGKLYFSYFRPSFHPWDHDNRDLLARYDATHETPMPSPQTA